MDIFLCFYQLRAIFIPFQWWLIYDLVWWVEDKRHRSCILDELLSLIRSEPFFLPKRVFLFGRGGVERMNVGGLFFHFIIWIKINVHHFDYQLIASINHQLFSIIELISSFSPWLFSTISDILYIYGCQFTGSSIFGMMSPCWRIFSFTEKFVILLTHTPSYIGWTRMKYSHFTNLPDVEGCKLV